MRGNYHHGNLRAALLDEGMRRLETVDEKSLSLREIAKRYGVSPGAPYAHFKNKDEYLSALADRIMQELAKKLEATRRQYTGTDDVLIEMGLTYILFFAENPHLFSLLTSESHHAEAVFWNKNKDLNVAFKVLEDVAEPILQQAHIPDEDRYNTLLAMWAMVHGLASIVYVPGISARLKEDPEGGRHLRSILSAFTDRYG